MFKEELLENRIQRHLHVLRRLFIALAVKQFLEILLVDVYAHWVIQTKRVGIQFAVVSPKKENKLPSAFGLGAFVQVSA